MKPSLCLAALLACLLPSSGALAFQRASQGANDAAQASACVAAPDTPTALFFNPGAQGWGEPGFDGYAGVALELNRYQVMSQGDRTESGRALLVRPSLSLLYRFANGVTVGLAGFTPYRLSLTWPEGWSGGGISETNDFSLYLIRPAVAWRPHRMIAFGAGLDLAGAFANSQRRLDQGPLSTETLGLTAGGSAGFVLRPLDWLFIGASYQSALALSLSGPAELGGQQGEGQVTMTLPHRVIGGVAFLPLAMVRLELDVELTFWTGFDELKWSFEDLPLQELVERQGRGLGVALRFGVELRPVDYLVLRSGYAFEPQTVPAEKLTPAFPEGQHHSLSVGAGLDLGWFYADVALLLELMPEAQTGEGNAFPGVYEGTWQSLFLSLGVRL